MVFLDTLNKGIWAIGDIGVSAEIRPEEAKHIRYLNIGTFLFCIINLLYFILSLSEEKPVLVFPIVQISTSVLCLLVYFFHTRGRYNTARIYCFSLFYAGALLTYPLSGKSLLDHFFIFSAIGYSFLVFPRKEKKLMTLNILVAFICYITILILYENINPILQTEEFTLSSGNQMILHIIFIVFVVFMMSGKYFTDKMEDALMEERAKLADMSALLKKMFGRYLSTEVMKSILDDPSSLELGGERKSVTIMMTDLRGFTALSERLEPEQVVVMLNAYFEAMVDIVLHYKGTINEIIGDALLVIFGAPQEMHDRAQRAIACAIAMQNAMKGVNDQNRERGLPEVDMGIGLNEAEVIVGNIGSSKRSKYGVVGSGVNMASRIESYTVGGQILVSESVRKEAGDVLRIDGQRDVFPKGAEAPIRIYEIGGIAGSFNLTLKEKDIAHVTLVQGIHLKCAVLDGKDVGRKGITGVMVRLSGKGAEIELNEPVELMTNIKMNLREVDEWLASKDFYGKIVASHGKGRGTHLIQFTSLPPEVGSYFQAACRFAAKPTQDGKKL